MKALRRPRSWALACGGGEEAGVEVDERPHGEGGGFAVFEKDQAPVLAPGPLVQGRAAVAGG